MDKDSIVILQKSSFPNDPKSLQAAGVVCKSKADIQPPAPDTITAPPVNENATRDWEANVITSNDVYHRLLVTSGLESVNAVDMTIIHPAEQHHFKRFITGSRHIVHEDPSMYEKIIVPFLAEKPKDLTWVENVLTGKSEADRVLFSDADTLTGFVLAQDYRWSGQSVQELHYLAIARDPKLTCLRDLRGHHISMLQQIAEEGRRQICMKHSADAIAYDQIIAYLHYPPTFYWLHVHLVHADKIEDMSMRAGRAHLLEEVIRNLQLDGDYYANRTITICLLDGSPMLDAVRRASPLCPPRTSVPLDSDGKP